jgi:glycerol-3-phosphate dehydrogenase (NAD(P)+)
MASSSDIKGQKIAVLGSGAFGCTLAYLFAGAVSDVSVWTIFPEQEANFNQTHSIEKPIPIKLPSQVSMTTDLEKALTGAQAILFCCTAQAVRDVATKTLPIVNKLAATPPPILVNACKGIELSTFMRMSEILEQVLPGYPVCAMSGPNLAVEMINGLPTAAVVASKTATAAAFVQSLLSVPSYRLYTNDDVCGVELAGALKNIYAIASGCTDGLKLGTNAKAALMARALSEMTRFGAAYGAKPQTFFGVAGVGDLIATCTSPLSRNYQLGFKMSQGESKESIAKQLGEVTEGASTCHAVYESAHKLGIDMPIVDQVKAIIDGEATPADALKSLLSRPVTKE